MNQRWIFRLGIAGALRRMNPSRRHQSTGNNGCFLDHVSQAGKERCHDGQRINYKSDDACYIACFDSDCHCYTSISLFHVKHVTALIVILLHEQLLQH